MAKKKPGKVKVKLKKAPPGRYDVGLDAMERAAERGYGNLLGDIKLGRRRAQDDLGIAGSETSRQKTELGEDITTARDTVERQYNQTLADLLTQQHGVERSYERLGNAQGQNFQAAGLAQGGAVQQAAQKRATNQALDLAPIDTARTRAGEAERLSLDDLLRQQQRGTQGLNRSLEATGLSFKRGMTDYARQQKQGHTELVEYRKDLGKTRMQQYLEMGNKRSVWVTPKQKKKWQKLGVV